MSKKTKRFLDIGAKIETREADGKRFIDGMIPYNSRSEEMWGFVEEISPSAFNKTLSDGSEIFAFWAHNTAEILGSRSAGTLTLDNRAEGLHFSVEMRDSAVSEDRWQAIQRGDVAGVSFGFITEREEWDNSVKPALRTLKEVRLLEISPGVAFPAYPGAQSATAIRSLCDESGVDVAAAVAAKIGLPPAEVRETESPEALPAPTAEPQEVPAAGLSPEERFRAELDLIAAEAGILQTA